MKSLVLQSHRKGNGFNLLLTINGGYYKRPTERDGAVFKSLF